MSKVNRQEVIKKIVEGLRINAAVDSTPDTCSNVIVPVFVCNEDYEQIIKDGQSAVSGTLSPFSVPNDSNDYYLASVFVSITKSAASDNTSVNLSATPKGDTSKVIVDLLTETLTAGSFSAQRDFNNPIKLQPSTNVTLTGNFAAGAMTKRVCFTILKKQKA